MYTWINEEAAGPVGQAEVIVDNKNERRLWEEREKQAPQRTARAKTIQ